jgi:hypothetical protein
MKVTKNQLEKMIQECIQQEVENLDEEQMQELLGGLRGLAGGIGQGIKNVAGKAASAVGGAAGKAAGAVRGAYQAGEKQAALSSVKKGLQGVVTTIDQALQKLAGDQNAQHDLENVKAAISSAQSALAESKRLTKIMNEGINPDSLSHNDVLDTTSPKYDLGGDGRDMMSAKMAGANLLRTKYGKKTPEEVADMLGLEPSGEVLDQIKNLMSSRMYDSH